MGLADFKQKKLSTRFLDLADRNAPTLRAVPTPSPRQSALQSLEAELSALLADEIVEVATPVQDLNLIWNVAQRRAANDESHDQDVNVEAMLALDPDLAIAHDDKDRDAKKNDLLMIKQQKRDLAQKDARRQAAREPVGLTSRSAFDISSSPTSRTEAPRMGRQDRISTLRSMIATMTKHDAPPPPAFKMRMAG